MADLDRVTITVELTLETNVHDGYIEHLSKMLNNGKYRLVVYSALGELLHTVRICEQHIERTIIDKCDACSLDDLVKVVAWPVS